MQFNHRYSSGIIKPQLLTIVVALLSHVYESLERSSFLAFFYFLRLPQNMGASDSQADLNPIERKGMDKKHV